MISIREIINPSEQKMSDQESNSPESKSQNMDKGRIFLNLAFILFALLAVFVEDIYLFFRAPHPGETAFLTFRSRSSFDFDQGKAYAKSTKRRHQAA